MGQENQDFLEKVATIRQNIMEHHKELQALATEGKQLQPIITEQPPDTIDAQTITEIYATTSLNNLGDALSILCPDLQEVIDSLYYFLRINSYDKIDQLTR